jgi:hypothetical protein
MVCPSCGHWLAPVVATVARQSATRPALALADAPQHGGGIRAVQGR